MKWGILILLHGALAGCGFLDAGSCENPERYEGSAEVAPVQVPEGLTPPDESRALKIPDTSSGDAAPVKKRGDCLESPPDYFEEDLVR